MKKYFHQIFILPLIIALTTNQSVAMNQQQSYPLNNNLIAEKQHIKNCIEEQSYQNISPAYYFIYILNHEYNMLEPVNDDNKETAFRYIAENNGIVCPTNSTLAQQLHILWEFGQAPNMKTIILGTTDCRMCDLELKNK